MSILCQEILYSSCLQINIRIHMQFLSSWWSCQRPDDSFNRQWNIDSLWIVCKSLTTLKTYSICQANDATIPLEFYLAVEQLNILDQQNAHSSFSMYKLYAIHLSVNTEIQTWLTKSNLYTIEPSRHEGLSNLSRWFKFSGSTGLGGRAQGVTTGGIDT